MNNRLQILGCGHSESVYNLNNNAALIVNNKLLLIDCGYTIKKALFNQELDVSDVDSIYISHVHGDHVFGLERIGYECLFKYKYRPALYIKEELYKELWDQTLKGSMSKIGEGEATLETFFDVKFIKNDSFKFQGIEIQTFAVKHTPNKPAYGICIGNKILYTTDTTPIPEQIKKHTFEVCFHDVTLSDYNPVHATLDSILISYDKETLEKMYLMSYEDNWLEFEEKVNKYFKGFVKEGDIFEF
ncbi:MBL fold metallo-hydrolase [Pseudoalteromonas shioyasakiensis]|uniref:MBL fold metallo-hydrolase n=1 Tax=Pseudoalteromonas shioyasakiensis TaxID=1190813 RepID=UPI0021184985|nr:MBL fold metallo-hydrolase [Pseudoalteromonas shioyasakiensis]MCQ8878794.1 MBL fold metallo-hydrolase [Pseudoalteromonas shioyasakiensis]